jgi:hypothetical protein
MPRLFFLCLIGILFCAVSLSAGEKPNTVLIHPGEVMYARFTRTGLKLKLVSASKEMDAQAQVILTLPKADPSTKNTPLEMKVENKFDKDLNYKAQARSHTLDLKMMAIVYPVVAGKISMVSLPPKVEEVAMYAFELEK